VNPSAVLLACLCFAPATRDDDPIDAALAKGLRRIEQGATNYPKHRQCFSCHHQSLPVFALTAARSRAVETDGKVLDGQLEFTLKALKPNRERFLKGLGIGGGNDTAAYALATLDAAGHSANELTDAIVTYLIKRQRDDGSWATSGNRPPSEGSPFTTAALAVRALKRYGSHLPTDEEKEKAALAIDRARSWLTERSPRTTEDKVFRLLGLIESGSERDEVEAARGRLIKEQNPDGSWSQTNALEGDAYATGSALVALRRTGVVPTARAYRKGVQFLLRTQKEDGSWFVQTRSVPIQVFFDNGDPGGKSQFISFAATGWAVLALLQTRPEVDAHPAPAELQKGERLREEAGCQHAP
jgi:N-acyl-D-amino-acid deacylase